MGKELIGVVCKSRQTETPIRGVLGGCLGIREDATGCIANGADGPNRGVLRRQLLEKRQRHLSECNRLH